MIDCENEIFTAVAAALRDKYPGITVKGETVLTPSEFPCACIDEADSYSHRASRDSASTENYTEVMYEVNVYSNKANAKKSECKSIFSTIDAILSGLGFTRNTKTPIPLDDATKYRIFGRYSAIVSRDKTIYRK